MLFDCLTLSLTQFAVDLATIRVIVLTAVVILLGCRLYIAAVLEAASITMPGPAGRCLESLRVPIALTYSLPASPAPLHERHLRIWQSPSVAAAHVGGASERDQLHPAHF
jgi:hypothetical protein